MKKLSLFFIKIKGPKFYFWFLGIFLTPVIVILLTTISIWVGGISLLFYSLLIFFWIVFSLILTFKSINKISTKFIVSIIQLIYQIIIIFVILFIPAFLVFEKIFNASWHYYVN